MADIKEKIEQELEQAREVCDTSGAKSGECAAAWDAVEELQAEASHQRSKPEQKEKLFRAVHCDDNPEAAECRIYDD